MSKNPPIMLGNMHSRSVQRNGSLSPPNPPVKYKQSAQSPATMQQLIFDRDTESLHSDDTMESASIPPRWRLSRFQNNHHNRKGYCMITLKYLLWALALILIACLVMLIANIALLKKIHALYNTAPIDSGVSRLYSDIENKITYLSDIYVQPDILQRYLTADLTQGITPIPCHSHNDYTRSVPLFKALSYGCSSIEADIWLDPSDPSNLLVAHTHGSLDKIRSLDAMYLSPIKDMINFLNSTQNSTWVFSSSPNTTLVLLLDFKTPSKQIWQQVQTRLAPLREQGYQSYWDIAKEVFVSRALTIVASGDIDFDLITSQESNSHRDVFLDAPLLGMDRYKYNASNSYYASSAFHPAIGAKIQPLASVNAAQIDKLRVQTEAAQDAGLKARYWATPSWPVGLMTSVWESLVRDVGVDILNVDDLGLATSWDWSICTHGWWSAC